LRYLDGSRRVIDIGCGPGYDTAWFFAHGVQALGVDASAEMVRIAKQLHSECAFEHTDLLSMLRSPNTFDGVWMAYCLLHFLPTDLPNLALKLAEITSAGAILFIATPVGETVISGVGPVAGLSDQDGNELLVPFTIWPIGALEAAFAEAFEVLWQEIKRPLEGRSEVCSILMSKLQKKFDRLLEKRADQKTCGNCLRPDRGRCRY